MIVDLANRSDGDAKGFDIDDCTYRDRYLGIMSFQFDALGEYQRFFSGPVSHRYPILR